MPEIALGKIKSWPITDKAGAAQAGPDKERHSRDTVKQVPADVRSALFMEEAPFCLDLPDKIPAQVPITDEPACTVIVIALRDKD